jgi:DNA-binding IclR family transcriptional regulator
VESRLVEIVAEGAAAGQHPGKAELADGAVELAHRRGRVLEGQHGEPGEAGRVLSDDPGQHVVGQLRVGDGARRRNRFTVTNGSREAAYASAPGRTILAHLEAAELDEFMSRTRLEARTDRTETSEARLREIVGGVRQRGYAVVVDELEYGITGIAVPVFDGRTVVGAVGCVTPSGYQTQDELVATRLPAIRAAAEHIAEELRRFPAFSHSVRWSRPSRPAVEGSRWRLSFRPFRPRSGHPRVDRKGS